MPTFLKHIALLVLALNLGGCNIGPATLPERLEDTVRGRAASQHQYATGHEPQNCEQFALEADEGRWEFSEWRDGTNTKLGGWFMALRVRADHGDQKTNKLRDEQWLLVEWPQDEEAPTKYSMSTLPATTSLKELVRCQKTRWLVERDFQELKDEFV